MTISPANELRVLQEFRLRTADVSGEIARIVAASPHPEGETAVPLLTSIDDPRDVATLRAATAASSEQPTDIERADREELAPFVSSWRPLRWYRSRFAQHAKRPPDHYRLAVTESGINDADGEEIASPAGESAPGAGAPIGQLWIGEPVPSYAGLLILVGEYRGGQFSRTSAGAEWPLALSRRMGVRIYEGLGKSDDDRARPDPAD